MSKINIKDENKDHKYFSILQNILSHLKLNAFERSLYWAIKEACGEFGECTKSHETLCEISGMKVTKLKETILSLSRINPILKKPLILVTHRTTIEGIKIPNKIVLTDLWEDNIRFFKEKFNQSPYDYRESPHDPGYSRSATGGGSRSDYKEDSFKKNPKEEEDKASSAFEKLSQDLKDSFGLWIDADALDRGIQKFGKVICRKTIESLKKEKPNLAKDKSGIFIKKCKDASCK